MSLGYETRYKLRGNPKRSQQMSTHLSPYECNARRFHDALFWTGLPGTINPQDKVTLMHYNIIKNIIIEPKIIEGIFS